jgi:hypothetical protein
LSVIQGFIPYGQIPNSHVCGVIIKVCPHEKIPFLGVGIMSQMLKKLIQKLVVVLELIQ